MLSQITPNIFVSDFDSSNDRPRLGYIKGEKLNIMIDAGNSPAHFNLFIEECKLIGLKSPDFIILTHWHWDHVFGLCATNIPVLASTKTQIKLIEMSHWKWDDFSMKERLLKGDDIEFCDQNMRIEYTNCLDIKVQLADITFTDECILNLADKTCVIKLTDNDHAPDSVVIYIPEERVLFLGDIISPDYHHGLEHYTKEKFYTLWRELLAYDFDYAIHGHTEIFTKETLNQFFIESEYLIKES